MSAADQRALDASSTGPESGRRAVDAPPSSAAAVRLAASGFRGETPADLLACHLAAGFLTDSAAAGDCDPAEFVNGAFTAIVDDMTSLEHLLSLADGSKKPLNIHLVRQTLGTLTRRVQAVACVAHQLLEEGVVSR